MVNEVKITPPVTAASSSMDDGSETKATPAITASGSLDDNGETKASTHTITIAIDEMTTNPLTVTLTTTATMNKMSCEPQLSTTQKVESGSKNSPYYVTTAAVLVIATPAEVLLQHFI